MQLPRAGNLDGMRDVLLVVDVLDDFGHEDGEKLLASFARRRESLVSLLTEAPAWPGGWGWPALIAMGLGPVGAAFFLWDYGTKRGDLRVLGSSAYAAPLLGALLLVTLGFGEPSLRLLLAALLIIGGAALASGDLWRPRAA